MENCKFANVVALSDEKIVAQLDCMDFTDGDKAILNKIAKVDGVVQTNIIAVVRPRKGQNEQGGYAGRGTSKLAADVGHRWEETRYRIVELVAGRAS